MSSNIFGALPEPTFTSGSPTDSILNSYIDRQSEFHTAPSSIQGMLKNTTETGDIGEFSIRPNQALPSTSRGNLRSSSLPYSPDGLLPHQLHQLSYQGHHRQQHKNDGRLNSLQSYQGTTASSVISLYANDGYKSLQPWPRHSQRDDQRTCSLSQSSHISYNLSNHRSHGDLRPRSPFVYPTRLKRPGYRPSSPALTGQGEIDTRSHLSLDRGASTKNSSLLSAYPPRLEYATDYQQHANRSVTSLHAPPSPLFIPRSRAPRTPSAQYYPSGRSSILNQSTRSSTLEIRRYPSYSSTWSHFPLPSPSPLYYDYTEAFEQENNLHPSNMSVLSLDNHNLPEEKTPDTVHELDAIAMEPAPVQPSAKKSLLDTQTNYRVSNVESPSPIATPNKFLLQMAEAKWKHDENTDILRNPIEKKSLEIKNFRQNSGCLSVTEQSEFRIDSPIGYHTLSSSPHSSRNRSVTDQIRSSSILNQTIPLEHQSRRYEGSIDSARSLATVSHGPHGNELAPAERKRSSMLKWKLPSFNFGRFDLQSQEPDIHGSLTRRSASLDVTTGLVQPEIHAPVPERATSSRSHTERYSRIFAMDENLPAEIHVVSTNKPESSLGQTNTETTGQVTGNDDLKADPVRPLTQVSSSCKASPYSSSKINAVEKGDKAIQSRKTNEPHQAPLLDEMNENLEISSSENHVNSTIEKPVLKVNSTVVKKEGECDLQNTTIAMNAFTNKHNANLTRSPPRETFVQPTSRVDANPGIVHLSSFSEPRMMPLLEAATIMPWMFDEPGHEKPVPITRFKLKTRSNISLRRSPTSPRFRGPYADYNPENLHDIDTSVQEHNRNVMRWTKMDPKCDAKISRVSGAADGTANLAGPSISPEVSSKLPSSSFADVFHSDGTFRDKGISISHPEIDTSAEAASIQVKSTLVANNAYFLISPQNWMRLRPSSPNLNSSDVRSYFSDDSSHIDPVQTIRQRFSQFRLNVSRGNSTDDLRSADRKQTSAMGKSRSSRPTSGFHVHQLSGQSGTASEDVSTSRRTSLTLREKIRKWWHRGEEKIKALGGKLKRNQMKKKSEVSDICLED